MCGAPPPEKLASGAAGVLPYCLLPPGGAVFHLIPLPGTGTAGSLALDGDTRWR